MKNTIFLVSAGVFAMLTIALLIIITPIFTIWALNILFPMLNIPYSLETWAAVVILFWILKLKIFVKN